MRFQFGVVYHKLHGAVEERHVEPRRVSAAERVSYWPRAANARRVLCGRMTGPIKPGMVTYRSLLIVLETVIAWPIVVTTPSNHIVIGILISLSHAVGLASSIRNLLQFE